MCIYIYTYTLSIKSPCHSRRFLTELRREIKQEKNVDINEHLIVKPIKST